MHPRFSVAFPAMLRIFFVRRKIAGTYVEVMICFGNAVISPVTFVLRLVGITSPRADKSIIHISICDGTNIIIPHFVFSIQIPFRIKLAFICSAQFLIGVFPKLIGCDQYPLRFYAFVFVLLVNAEVQFDNFFYDPEVYGPREIADRSFYI
jgi:hypothetical protein